MDDSHLTDEQRRILRDKGTEAPFSGEYYHFDEEGMYKCAACGTELFSSENKYENHTLLLKNFGVHVIFFIWSSFYCDWFIDGTYTI